MKSRTGGLEWCGGKRPNGGVRAVKGVLPIALRARAEGRIGILVPPDNAAEAAVVSGLQVIPIRNLREAVSFLEGEVKISPTKVDIARMFDHAPDGELDFAEVKGQESVKRALEIAAVGGHVVRDKIACTERALAEEAGVRFLPQAVSPGMPPRRKNSSALTHGKTLPKVARGFSSLTHNWPYRT